MKVWFLSLKKGKRKKGKKDSMIGKGMTNYASVAKYATLKIC